MTPLCSRGPRLPRALRTTAPALALLVSGALAGCGDDDADGTPATTGSPTTLAEVTEDPAAEQAVTEAITTLRVGGTGTFSAHLEYADQVFDLTGSYRLDPAGQRLTVVGDKGEGRVESEAVGVDGDYVVRLPADGPVLSRCWVRGDPSRIAEVVGLETNPAFRRLPGAVVLASTAVGIAPDPSRAGDVLGSVDLATALGLISPRLPGLLGLAGDERVLAHLTITDEALTGITVDGDAILAALDEAGTDVDQAALEEAFAAEAPVSVGLDNAGSKVVVEGPRESAVIDLAAPDAQQRLSDCTE